MTPGQYRKGHQSSFGYLHHLMLNLDMPVIPGKNHGLYPKLDGNFPRFVRNSILWDHEKNLKDDC